MSVESLTTRPAPPGPTGTPPDRAGTAWVAVCHLADLVPERGAAALVAGEQVALFRLDGDEVLAVQQRDPFMDAHVLSRGIVGSRGDRPTVASPLLKQVFDLRTGRCLDAVGRAPQHLRTWRVRVEHGVVLVAATPEPPPADDVAPGAGAPGVVGPGVGGGAP